MSCTRRCRRLRLVHRVEVAMLADRDGAQNAVSRGREHLGRHAPRRSSRTPRASGARDPDDPPARRSAPSCCTADRAVADSPAAFVCNPAFDERERLLLRVAIPRLDHRRVEASRRAARSASPFLPDLRGLTRQAKTLGELPVHHRRRFDARRSDSARRSGSPGLALAIESIDAIGAVVLSAG